jgi:pentose-5-phosphate-3-epimerase
MAKPYPKLEATSPETSADRFRALVQEGADFASLVAANEACPPDLLRTLAEHKDAKVRQRVVANPQTPVEVVAKLGSQFPEQLLDNPAFDTYLLERPDLLEGIGASALRSLVKRDICPMGFWEYAARFDDQASQLYLLMNAAAPKMAVERLLQSAHRSVKDAAQWHVNLQVKPLKNWRGILTASVAKSLSVEQPSEAINALAYIVANILDMRGHAWAQEIGESDILRFRTPGFQISSLAANPSTPPSVLERLAEDKSADGWDSVAFNPSTPASLLERLAGHKDEDIRESVAQNPAAPPLILELLAEDKKTPVRWWVAANPSTPGYVLERLAKDRNEIVRSNVASNLSAPPAVLESLAEDKEESIRTAVAHNPCTPPRQLKRWVDDKIDRFGRTIASLQTSADWDRYGDELALESTEFFLATLAANPSTPVSALERLAKVQRKVVQRHLVQNPSTPLSVLEQLAVEKTVVVRAAVASSPSAPVVLLERLALDDQKDVRKSIAQNVSAPGFILDRLAGDADKGIRMRVAGNLSTPGSVLERLAGDEDKDTRTAAAANRSAPIFLLDHLALSDEPDVRRSVAENTSAPGFVLARLAEDEDKNTRTCVAGNPSTPVSALERLAEDTDTNIRTVVAGNPSSPGSVLQRLFLVSTEVSSEIINRVTTSVAGSDPLSDLMALRAQMLGKLTSGTTPSASRLLGLRLPYCPVVTLEKAQRSTDWRERCSVASNPNTPLAVVQLLAQDGNVLVRAAAQERLNAEKR